MATTKVIIGCDCYGVTAVFPEIKETNNGDFLCVSQTEGHSYCSEDWVNEELTDAPQKEIDFMLGFLFACGYRNLEVVNRARDGR